MDEEIRKALSDEDLTELYRVEHYEGYRRENRISIDILDIGENPDDRASRYTCRVIREHDGFVAQGNPSSSIRGAIDAVHWDDIDGTPIEE